MGEFKHSIQSEIEQLKNQLKQVHLTQRDTSFKFSREQQVLKRLIASLSDACQGDNNRLNEHLIALRESLEQQKDVTILIPRLALLDRILKKQTLTMEKQHINLDHQIRNGGETLLRISGLPSKVKRDLRDLLSFSGGQAYPKAEQAMKLLGIYERSVKIIASNPNIATTEINQNAERELLSKLSEELQNLITELDFEGDSGDKLIDVRAKLLIGVSVHSLLEITLTVLRLVVEGTQHERKSSEKFLDQLNTSLSTQLKSSGQSVEQSQSYHAHRQEMNRELSGLANKSQQLLKDDHDLPALKARLEPMLHEINSLSERLSHAEQRERALIERMIHTNTQLEALHETTQDYRRRLDEQAERLQRDPLTKIYNRTAFNEQLELEYHRWIRTQHSLRVVLLDIDGFKSVNENFGFTAGDKAIKIIARTISNELSKTEIVARFSGEEFTILIPEGDETRSLNVVKEIQRKVAKLPFKFRDKSLQITLSAASVEFRDNDTPEEVLERLNRALIECKKLGKNNLVWK
jgi:diguanylate cyclase (GGDEF)-like protein